MLELRIHERVLIRKSRQTITKGGQRAALFVSEIRVNARLLHCQRMNVTVDEIEKHLGEYLNRVLEGETVTVFSDDRPVAEIRPLSETSALRPIGLAAGEIVVPDDFDEPLPEDVLEQFEGTT